MQNNRKLTNKEGLELSTLTETCVKCGACLNHCPTYLTTKNECESPRGRISIINALAQEKAQPSSRGIEHINNCLNCFRCMDACPANVPYDKIIEKAKQEFTPPSLFSSIAIRMISKYRVALKLILWVMQPLTRFLPRYEPKNRIQQSLNLIKESNLYWQKKVATPSSPSPKRVSLFIDCSAHFFGAGIVKKLLKVFSQHNIDCQLIDNHCCGRLAKHQGMKTDNTSLPNVDRLLLTLNTGCSPQTKDPLVQSISALEFLCQLLKDAILDNDNRVVMWLPCSISNSEKAFYENWPYKKLKGLGCCGAAGSQFISNPKKAQVFVEHIKKEMGDAQIVLTPNQTCLLHLKTAFNDNSIQFKHPLEWVLDYILMKNKS